MVVLYNFRDIFEDSSKQSILSLPTIKQNFMKIDFKNNDNYETVFYGQEPPLPFAASQSFNTSIANWRQLTAKDADCKTVYEVTFDISGNNLNFRPGDTIGIIPRNLDAEVDVIIDHLDLDSVADCSYILTVNSGQKGARIPAHIPIKSNLRHVLTHCVDLRGVIKKLFLLALSRYTTNPTEQRVLEYLCSKEGSAAYTTHILNKKICLLELFEIFQTCKPPIEVIMEHLPRLLPRPYSIVNSGLKDTNELKICFSVMNIDNNRKGLVTGRLEQIITECSLEDMMKNINITDEKGTSLVNKIPIYFRKNINHFSFPESFTCPMLLIGPGTGVAPYIGFLEERQYRKENKKDTQGMVWLFFGSRNPELDFIYKDEIKEFLSAGALNKLTTAFSRMENSENRYIQDALLQNGEEVAKLLKEGAMVYVCGDVRTLAPQVRDILVKCVVEFTNNTQEEAEKFICDMQKDKRYLVDSWN